MSDTQKQAAESPEGAPKKPQGIHPRMLAYIQGVRKGIYGTIESFNKDAYGGIPENAPLIPAKRGAGNASPAESVAVPVAPQLPVNAPSARPVALTQIPVVSAAERPVVIGLNEPSQPPEEIEEQKPENIDVVLSGQILELTAPKGGQLITNIFLPGGTTIVRKGDVRAYEGMPNKIFLGPDIASGEFRIEAELRPADGSEVIKRAFIADPLFGVQAA